MVPERETSSVSGVRVRQRGSEDWWLFGDPQSHVAMATSDGGFIRGFDGLVWRSRRGLNVRERTLDTGVDSVLVTASLEWLVKGDPSLLVMIDLDTGGCNEFGGGGGVGQRNALMKGQIWTMEVIRRSGQLVKSCCLLVWWLRRFRLWLWMNSS